MEDASARRVSRDLGHEQRTRYLLLLTSSVLAVGIAVAAWSYYRHYEERYRNAVDRELSAVSELKVRQLAQYRTDHFGYASIVFRNGAFSQLVARFLEHPEEAGARELRVWLTKLVHGDYDRISLFDTHGIQRMWVPENAAEVDSDVAQSASAALQSREVVFHDFYRDEYDQRIYLTLLIPVLGDQAEQPPLAVLALRIDPERYLYPLLESWPSSSATAETLLVRREGSDVVFLNPLRFQSDAALSLRIPLTRRDVPAVQAALGTVGIVEGHDYRQVPVIAAVRAVPDSPWILISRIDRAEVYAPANQHWWGTLVVSLALLLNVAAVARLLWWRQRSRRLRERYEAVRSLMSRDRRYRELVDRGWDITALLNPAGEIDYISDSVTRTLGYGIDEYLGRSPTVLVHPDDAESVTGELRSLRSVPGNTRRIEVRVRHKDGRWIWLDMTATNLLGTPGVGAVVVSARDITDRKQAEEALQRQKYLYDMLSQTNQAIVRATKREELFPAVCRIAVAAARFRIAWIGMQDPDSSRIRTAARSGEGAAVLVSNDISSDPADATGCGPSGRAFHTGLRVVSNDFLNDPATMPWREEACRAGVRASAAFPIRERDTVVGVLSFYASEAGFFDADVLATLDAVAMDLSFALDRFASEAERIRAQLEVQASQEMYDDLVSNVPCGVFRFKMKASGGYAFDFVSDRWCEMSGVEREDALKDVSLVFSRLHPEDLPSFGRQLELVRHTLEPFVWEGRGIVGGETRLIHLESRPTRLANGDVLWSGVQTDITDRRRAEEAMRESEGRFRLVADLTNQLVWTAEANGAVSFLNAGADETFAQSIHPEDAQGVAEAWQQAVRFGQPYHSEFRLLGADGVFRWYLSRGIPVRDESGSVVKWYGSATDINELREVQRRLDENEERLRLTIGAAEIGLFDVDLRTGRVHYSPEWKRQIGYEEHEISTRFREWQDRVHPDDIDRCMRIAQAAMADSSAGYEMEFRFKHRNGSYRWIMSQASVRRDEQGTPIRLLGSHIDITEMKRAQRDLIARNAALEAAANAVVITDRDGAIQWANRAFTTLTGFAPEEVLGKNPRTLVKSGRHSQDFYKHLWDTILAGQVWSSEIVNRRKDGSLYDEDLTITPLRDEHGEISQFIAIKQDITERKRAEAALRESEEHYRSLFDNMMNGYAHCRMLFTDGRPTDFVYLEVNHSFEILTGLKDVVGKTGSEIVPAVTEADSQLIEIYGRVASTGVSEQFERYVDSMKMWFSISVYSPSSEHFVAVFDVITERKQAEQALSDSQSRLSGIIDSAMDGIITVDDDQRILVFNTAAEKMFGCPASEAIGKPVERFLPDRFRNKHYVHLQGFAQLGSGERSTGQFVQICGVRADGVEFPIEASISKAQVNSQLLLTIILRDITDRLRGEETRAQLEDQLRVAQKMEALGTLAGGIAHDFNNILGAILGNVALAEQDIAADDPAMESLREIDKASHRAKDLVQQILAFSSQQFQPQSVVDLGPVVEEAVRLLRATLPAGIELCTVCDPATPSVIADPTQIHQVLMNLCTNAWHAIGHNTGRIDVRLGDVWVDEDSSDLDSKLYPGHFAQLSVTDTGVGMDANTLERVFEPFFTTKAVGQGTGLGLSVVHGIVKAHGGAVTVTSQPGCGTTFRLYFPAAEAPREEVAQAERNLGARPLVCDRHVLYLDDEEALVFLVRRMLERVGYKVSGFTQAAAALAAVRDDQMKFDLVVTDFNMPGLSGLDVAREVKRLRPEMPVVMTSGYITEELRAAAPEAGVVQLIHKPDTVEELCAVVQRLVGESTPEHGG